jgi:hypothetical protein
MGDQPNANPSTLQRSTIVRCIRWLWRGRGMLHLLITLAWTVTLIVLCYGFANWRGRRVWNQYRNAAEARGESLEFATYVPKPVPDDQNFATTPFLKSFFLHRNDPILTNDLYTRAGDHVPEIENALNKSPRHFLDLAAWQMASTALQNGPLKPEQKFATQSNGLAARAAAAPAILERMKSDQEAFAEIRAASTREFSRYPVNYDLENPWGILLPHLAKIKQLCQRLNLQTCAELALGQSAPALDDVKLSLALTDSMKSEPFLISILVRGACLQIALQSVWEGLAEHRWTDAQLQELQARLASYNFLADVQNPLLAERACGVLTADLVKKNGFEKLSDNGDEHSQTSPYVDLAINAIGIVMPSGWYDRERLGYATSFDAQKKGVMDLGARIVSPAKVASNAEELTRQIYGGPAGSPLQALLRHHAIAALLLKALDRIPAKIAIDQTVADQAALACALERYRLAHGEFPERLEALAPAFMSRLPNDVITGQPYKYRRTNDGQFILYSVGWDEKDNGGTPGKTLFDLNQGDWVWQYPAIQP